MRRMAGGQVQPTGAHMIVVIVIVVDWSCSAALLLHRPSATRSSPRATGSNESWSGIDVQLKSRHDLVPNLVESVKGYAAHESQTFEKVTKARAEAMSAQGVDDTRQSRGEAERGADRSARRGRELPAVESHRKLPAAEPEPLRAGGRNPGLAADLQLQRAVLQHRHPAVPRLDHRQPGRLHARASTSKSKTRPIANRSRSASTK